MMCGLLQFDIVRPPSCHLAGPSKDPDNRGRARTSIGTRMLPDSRSLWLHTIGDRSPEQASLML